MKKPTEFARALTLAQKYTSDNFPLVRVMVPKRKLGLNESPFVRVSATDAFCLVDITLKGAYGAGTCYVDRWTQVPQRGIQDASINDDQLGLRYHGGKMVLLSESDKNWAKPLDGHLEQDIPPRTVDSAFQPKLLGKILTDMARFGNHPVTVRQLSELKPMRLEMDWEEGSFTALLMPMRTPKKEEA